ncbi:Uncharacterised protein [Mycobacteroides abscessus subsp. abscessus]|nr:Uncharacterised protein [Mycobacteroides abscessus subsp. abscessus]
MPARHTGELAEFTRHTVERVSTAVTGDLPGVRVVEIDLGGDHLAAEAHVDEVACRPRPDHDRHVPERQSESRLSAYLRADGLRLHPELTERQQEKPVELVADSPATPGDQLVDDGARRNVDDQSAVDVEVLERYYPMLRTCDGIDRGTVVVGELRRPLAETDARQVGVRRKSHIQLGHRIEDRLPSV